MGKTGRTFHTKYKEHMQVIKNSNSSSGYLNHILNTGHRYGAITDTMDITRTHKKGKYLHTLEKYYICRSS
jgi:hypothetical protein